MDDIVIEIPFNQEEDFYIICHYCNILKKKENIISCTIDDCYESFCADCIIQYFAIENDFKEMKEESIENGWACFKCQKLCNCKKCKPIKEDNICNHQIKKKKIKKDKKEEFKKGKKKECIKEKIFNIFKEKKPKKPLFFSERYSLKQLRKSRRKLFFIPNKNEKITEESGKDAFLIDSIYNGYKPIFDISETKFPYIPPQKPIISKIESNLIKIARTCEHFFRHKCKNNYFKKTCSICHKNEHHTNELVRFKNYKDFINYLRYLFLCMENVLNYNNDIFIENKNEFIIFYNEFEKKLNKWGFKNPKVICKLCIFEILNHPNSLKFLQEKFKDSKTENLLNSDNDKIYENKNEKIFIEEKLHSEATNFYNDFLQSVSQLIEIAMYFTKLHYCKINSLKQIDCINIKEQLFSQYNIIEKKYDQLNQFLFKYIHFINELILNKFHCSTYEKDSFNFFRFILNLKVKTTELKNQFDIGFEKLKIIFEKYISNIDEEIKSLSL